ncbi:MAG: hypothetical protein ACMXYK_02475 [Candidatus Woesearchaeota archaeon]
MNTKNIPKMSLAVLVAAASACSSMPKNTTSVVQIPNPQNKEYAWEVPEVYARMHELDLPVHYDALSAHPEAIRSYASRVLDCDSVYTIEKKADLNNDTIISLEEQSKFLDYLHK